MVLKGKVKSGLNSFSFWMAKLAPYYTEKTGMQFYPGTLNVLLPAAYNLPETAIRLEKEEYGGRVSVAMQPCKVFGRKAFILRTDQNAAGEGDHPLNLIEIATDVRLREVYALKDEDEIEIEIEQF